MSLKRSVFLYQISCPLFIYWFIYFYGRWQPYTATQK